MITEERLAALEAQMAALVEPPTEYYTSRWSGEEIDNRIASLSNRNLLDNWYFVGGGSQQGGTPQGLVVRLAAARGENQFGGLAPQAGGDTPAGVGQHFGGFLPHRMQAAGVAVGFTHGGDHGLYGRRAGLGGGGVICINLHSKILSRRGAGRALQFPTVFVCIIVRLFFNFVHLLAAASLAVTTCYGILRLSYKKV